MTPSATAHTVLVVDDDKTTVEILARKLKQAGFNVLSATDGDMALQLARQYKGAIDLLLTDVIMPKMNGPALAELLVVTRPRTRILFMSGLVQASAIPSQLRARSSFVQKQHPIDVVIESVQNVLRDSSLQRSST
jgi:DNA-binding response OmpR family regulator